MPNYHVRISREVTETKIDNLCIEAASAGFAALQAFALSGITPEEGKATVFLDGIEVVPEAEPEPGEEQRRKALATYLEELGDDEVEGEGYISRFDYSEDRHTFEARNESYRVLTNDEADEAAEEAIDDSLWAFRPSFIVSHTKLPRVAESIIEKAAEELCEDASPVFRALIPNFGHFVKDAISSDGRGHFLSQYDGEETEVEVDGITFYIYRNN